MPLGKLSQNGIDEAYEVLGEIHAIVLDKDSRDELLLAACNKFYSLIPHSFGNRKPLILDNEEIIQAKCEMLESLRDMEIAYKILSTNTGEHLNPLDGHYEQLHADIDVIDKECEEFKLIELYAKNTHADTHRFSLEIEEIFKVKRQGEFEQYKTFEHLHNKKLLWHGSRTINFASILSKGLRITPPEALRTGNMFGEGIYFADMVSKSVQYCDAYNQNPTGLLLLCEVALGNMYKRYQNDSIKKLPIGKHSIFGKGKTCPNPDEFRKLSNDVEVPCGTPIKAADVPKNAALLYNEYIVYNIAQVKVQYLVRMKFNYDHET